MRRIDPRYYLIAVLVLVASALGYYRAAHHPRAGENEGSGTHGLFSAAPQEPTPEGIGAMIDTTLQILGAQKKFILRHMESDSGRRVPELKAGVPSAFDELRLIRALTDSLRAASYSVAAQKSLREKTTVIRISGRSHELMYRCLLYRKELSH